MLSEINAGPATRAIFRHRIQYGRRLAMKPLLKQIQHTPLLWMVIVVPVVLVAEAVTPHSYTLLFVLSVLAIVPLAALLSHATEAVAAKTGDAIGGLLNATLGNLTELIIAVTALHAGQYMLVKASIAGAIVTNGSSCSVSVCCSAASAITSRNTIVRARGSTPVSC
jgi:Ca2+/H+ antiporter